jgi:hypothetical protein
MPILCVARNLHMVRNLLAPCARARVASPMPAPHLRRAPAVHIFVFKCLGFATFQATIG